MINYPYLDINGEYFKKEFLDSIWKELLSKAPIWTSGLDKPTACDRLAYVIMNQITMEKPNFGNNDKE